MLKRIIFLGYIDPGTGFLVTGGLAGLAALLAAFFAVLLIRFKKALFFLKKNRNLKFLIIIIFIVTGLVTAGAVFFYMQKKELGKRIIILGFDALSPEITEQLMDEGALPNFARLKEAGSYRRLQTTNPSQSPVAWCGFATGSNPGKHGIFDFITRDPATYGLDLATSKIKNMRPVKVKKISSFWDYLSRKKIPVSIINCPVTFPPEKISGKMLAGMGVPDILGTEGTFTYYTTEDIGNAKDTGGRVFRVQKDRELTLHLIGPRRKIGNRIDNLKVLFSVTIPENRQEVVITLNNKRLVLKEGQWSDWQEVGFRVDLFRTMMGIFRFYLVEAEPEFKLYISPINLDPRRPFFEIAYPGGYSKKLASKIGLFHTQGMPFDTWAVNEKRLNEDALLEQIDEVYLERKKILENEMADFKTGVLFMYFEDADIIQHMFWRYMDKEHPLYEKNAPEKYKDAIKDCYKKLDSLLGEVMSSLKKEDTLIVLSDHGFGTFKRAANINSWLRANGYLQLKHPAALSGGELLEDVDWLKTKAYAVGFGGIYVNQKARERDGIVSPGTETQTLKAEIAAKLKSWIDEKYNLPVVNSVYPKEDIFWGPALESGPDLYAGFNIGYRASWQTALGACPEVLLEDNLKKWSADHLFDPKLVPGVLFINRKITAANPSIYDIAPTILKEAGFSSEEIKNCAMDGRPF